MTEPMQLTFSAPTVTADKASRTITGQIVPFNSPGNTSAGKVMFLVGSIADFDPADIKLLVQHDMTRPTGRGVSAQHTPNGITMSFKVAETTTGNDMLVEASDGLRDGLSVGAIIDKFSHKDGVMHVSAARLVEVSLVTDPAFSEARVLDVAASENPETPDGETAPEENTTEEETVDEVTESPVAEEVTASAVPVQAAAAPIYAAPRSPINDGASYLEHTIKAAMGNDDSRMYVRAADDDSSTNTGLTLPPHLNEFISNTIGSRPAFDAVRVERLVDTGLSFTIPKLTTAPTSGDVNEGAALTETGTVSSYITVNVNKFAGLSTVSWELLDRSGPSYYNELLREMQNAYALATDKALIAAFTASGTAATSTAATATGFQSFVATETAAAYKATGKFARNLVASPDVWGALMGYQDGSQRPIYSASNPANNPGNVGPQSVRGQVLGLDLYVDHGITTSGVIDESSFIVAPDCVSVYESPTTRLQVNQLGNGLTEIALYGYLGIAIKQGAGVRRFNLT